MKRIVANLFTVGMAALFLVRNVKNDGDLTLYVIFTLPYILSNSLVALMLILSSIKKPKAVDERWSSFIISFLGTNLTVILGLLGVKLLGAPVFPQVALYASLLTVMTVPLYMAAVMGLGRSLTVLPEANKLKTGGMYRVSRHPLYLCYIIWYVLQIFIGQTWIIIPVSLVQGYLQVRRARAEEAILETAFPEYVEYKKRVGWFFGIGVIK